MNSKDLVLRGFSEPVDFVEGKNNEVPAKTGVYVIIRKDKQINYRTGQSDIVKIGKCEYEKGFFRAWHEYFHPGPTQDTNIRLKEKFLAYPHAFSWKEIPKGRVGTMEKVLFAEFVRAHGQLPAYNLVHKRTGPIP